MSTELMSQCKEHSCKTQFTIHISKMMGNVYYKGNFYTLKILWLSREAGSRAPFLGDSWMIREVSHCMLLTVINQNSSADFQNVSDLSSFEQYMSPVKRICVFEHCIMTNFNCAYPAIQRGQGSGFLSKGSSWLTAFMSEQRRFWRDCVDAQARLNLRCSHRR